MKIEADEITYEVTRRYGVSGIDPVHRWGEGPNPGPLLTPCLVTVTWGWTLVDPDPPEPWVKVYGYHVRADGTRANKPVTDIAAYAHRPRPDWPNWLAELVNDRPALVTAYGG